MTCSTPLVSRNTCETILRNPQSLWRRLFSDEPGEIVCRHIVFIWLGAEYFINLGRIDQKAQLDNQKLATPIIQLLALCLPNFSFLIVATLKKLPPRRNIHPNPQARLLPARSLLLQPRGVARDYLRCII